MTTVPQPTPPQLPPHERDYYLARREAVLCELRALDRLLGLPQTVATREERQQERLQRRQECVPGV